MLRDSLDKKNGVDIKEICSIVEQYQEVNDEDFQNFTPGNQEPKWKRNVRNALHLMKRQGEIDWDEKTHSYRLK